MNAAIESFWIVLGGTLGLCATVVLLALFYAALNVAMRVVRHRSPQRVMRAGQRTVPPRPKTPFDRTLSELERLHRNAEEHREGE